MTHRPEIPNDYCLMINAEAELQSLLYDLNILPECLASADWNDQETKNNYRRFFLICGHFKIYRERILEQRSNLLTEQAIIKVTKQIRLTDDYATIQRLVALLKRLRGGEDALIVMLES